jgi:hypothetical protein
MVSFAAEHLTQCFDFLVMLTCVSHLAKEAASVSRKLNDWKNRHAQAKADAFYLDLLQEERLLREFDEHIQTLE